MVPLHHNRPPGPHGPHGGPGPDWMFNAAGPIDRERFFEQVAEIAGELAESGSVTLGETIVEIPAELEGVVRFERTPHGTLALVIRAEWSEDSAIPKYASSPINALRNGADR